ncbi:Uncharacterized protein QTN25_004313 [Entamoeba marina]
MSKSEYNPTLVPDYSTQFTYKQFRITVQTETFATNTEEYLFCCTETNMTFHVSQSDCFFITFSACDREIDMKIRGYHIFFLVGCKIDLTAYRVIINEEALIKAKELNVEYYETSSITGDNVDLVFGEAIEIIMSKRNEPKKEEKKKWKDITNIQRTNVDVKLYERSLV